MDISYVINVATECDYTHDTAFCHKFEMLDCIEEGQHQYDLFEKAFEIIGN